MIKVDSADSVAWAPDSLRLAAGYSDGKIVVWYTANGEKLRVLEEHLNSVNSLAWSPDGTKLASGSWDHSVYLWDPDRGLK